MRTAVVMDGCIFACVALVECISTGKPVASANFSNAMVNQSMVSSEILTLICYLIIGLSSGNLLAKTISLARSSIKGDQPLSRFSTPYLLIPMHRFPRLFTYCRNYRADPNRKAKTGPRFGTKYKTLDECKAACAEQVAGCTAINYLEYVFREAV